MYRTPAYRPRALAHFLSSKSTPRFYSNAEVPNPPKPTAILTAHQPSRYTPLKSRNAPPDVQAPSPTKTRGKPPAPSTSPSPQRARYALTKRPDITDGHERPSQRPFGVSTTIQKLFKEDKFKEAVEMVEKAPISSQNVVVWTLLVQEALERQQFNLALKLWNNMKKRGFKPTSRSYATFFSGCTKLDSVSPSAIDRVRGIWSDFQDYKAQLQSENARGEAYPAEASVSPYVPYLVFESQHTLGEGIMDIFHSMAKSGPFSPDKFVFSTTMNLIAKRRAFREGGSICRQSNRVAIQNAADVTRIWGRMKESAANENVEIDSHALAAFLRGLTSGSEEQRKFGVEVGSEHLGFKQDKRAEPLHGIQLERHALNVFLELCNLTGQYELCLACTRELMVPEKDNKTASRLNCNNFHHALTAYGYLSATKEPELSGTTVSYAQQSLELIEWMLRMSYSNVGAKIRPDRKCFNLALLTSWRCGDWASAEAAFSIMTGLDHSAFDQPSSLKAISSKPEQTREDLDTQSMSYMMRTALESQDHRIMAKCVRIFLHYGVEWMLPPEESLDARQRPSIMGKVEGVEYIGGTYFQGRLADSLVKVLSILWATKIDPKERKDFKHLHETLKPIRSNFRKRSDVRPA